MKQQGSGAYNSINSSNVCERDKKSLHTRVTLSGFFFLFFAIAGLASSKNASTRRTG
jgi:hypothetical protein